jgi:hypothetical protein
LTALATLLADDETKNHATWTELVGRDLKALGAAKEEIVWVLEILDGFHPAMSYLYGADNQALLTPSLAVTCLSSICSVEAHASARLDRAARRAAQALAETIKES